MTQETDGRGQRPMGTSALWDVTLCAPSSSSCAWLAHRPQTLTERLAEWPLSGAETAALSHPRLCWPRVIIPWTCRGKRHSYPGTINARLRQRPITIKQRPSREAHASSHRTVWTHISGSEVNIVMRSDKLYLYGANQTKCIQKKETGTMKSTHICTHTYIYTYIYTQYYYLHSPSGINKLLCYRSWNRTRSLSLSELSMSNTCTYNGNPQLPSQAHLQSIR